MQRAIDLFFRTLELLIVVCLTAMVVMVFGNVVLRYTVNSGILISEEMSRYCFIWLTYLGAMVVMREQGHLGVDMLVRQLSVRGRKLCLFASEILMLWCNALLVIGTWRMHELQVTNVSPVVGISMIWIFGIGYIVGTVMALFNLQVLWRLLSGRISDEELVQVRESEETLPPVAGTGVPR
jgi:TRAP-type C4-dicarboxylate transport system permease small subunit